MTERGAGSSLGRRLGATMALLTRIAKIVLGSPLGLWRRLRGAMTPSSVTLLVFGIVSVNIIWGYPWIGIFSACASLLVVGRILNRWMLPQLKLELLTPRSAAAGTAFPAVVRLRNLSSLPAMDLEITVAVDGVEGWGESTRRVGDQSHDDHGRRESRVLNPRVALIPPAGQVSLRAHLCCQRRGIHTPPDIQVTTWFPFHFFRHTRRIRSIGEIAITPRLLSSENDPQTRDLLDLLGNWTRRLFAGDALDYTGSREFEPGVPVRRWDFASWARLGTPIIREYESPALPTATLIVDTSADNDGASNTAEARLEQLLSMAATAIEQILRRSVHVHMFVTGQHETGGGSGISDRETLLIRLASCQHTARATADREIADFLAGCGQAPVLVLTARHQVPTLWTSHRHAFILTPDGEAAMTVDHAGASVRARPPAGVES